MLKLTNIDIFQSNLLTTLCAKFNKKSFAKHRYIIPAKNILAVYKKVGFTVKGYKLKGTVITGYKIRKSFNGISVSNMDCKDCERY
jgi:hypothetical protein